MGRKVNPIGFRLGIVSDWESKWYGERNYTDQLHEDIKIRRLVMRELTRAGISRIELERSANKVDVTLHTSKPGIVIGKQGAKGVMIKLSGRLGGAEMSRTVTEKEGRVPRQTLRADIDYGIVHAHTTY